MPQNPLNLPLGAHLSPAITSNTGTQVKTGAGVFMGMEVNTAGTAWQAVIYDGTNASGIVLGTVTLNALGPITFPPLSFKTGLFINTTGTTAGSAKAAYF